MLKTILAIFCLWICGFATSVCLADNYALADGTTVSGDPVTFGDTGIILREADDKYTDRLPWTKFSQEGLRQLAQNGKIKPFVEPFMALPRSVGNQPSDDIKLQPVQRLDLPEHHFLLAGLASSSVGLVLLLLIYAANLYAAYEVASCRGRPLGMVMGVSAVLPLVGPAIFYSLRTNVLSPPTTATAATEAGAAAAAGGPPAAGAPQSTQDLNPSEAVVAAVAAAARAARSRAATDPVPANDPALEGIQISALPASPKEALVSQSFKRGQFTFNRRFFETKFAGFMQPVRSEADQKLEFTLKLAQAAHVVQRISRIGANEVHLEVLQDQQVQEIMVPFGEIQEVTIKTKTA